MRIDTTRARRLPVIATTAAAALGACAVADFIGWTATRRQVTGGHLINIFAVTNNSTDVIVNVSGNVGEDPSSPTAGRIWTNSLGGFRQTTSASQSLFAPSPAQNWTTLDSFLTVGGDFNAATNAWLGYGVTIGDSAWYVSYFDTDIGKSITVNSFSTPSNTSGFQNRYAIAIPPTGGWFLAPGVSSRAHSLTSIDSIRLRYQGVNGRNYGASSAAAAAATHGYLVAQLYVSELGITTNGHRFVSWKQGATLRRADGTEHSATFEFRIGQACVGDLNQDGVVNGEDLGALLAGWGPCPAGCAPDIENDGAVNGVDLGLLLAMWGPCTG